MNKIPAPVKTYLRAFFGIVLMLFIADGADVFAVSMTDLKAWLAAGIGAAGALALKALDPTTGQEADFGRTTLDG